MSTRIERTEQIAELVEVFKGATAFYVTKYEGMTVAGLSDVRGKLRDVDAKYIVVKNTLALKALSELEVEGFETYFKGPTGIVVTTAETPTGAAKVVNEFNKGNSDKMEMKAAYYDGTIFVGEQAKALASMPSREDLYSMFLSCLNAPVTKFAATLQGVLVNFVRTVDAVREKKENN